MGGRLADQGPEEHGGHEKDSVVFRTDNFLADNVFSLRGGICLRWPLSGDYRLHHFVSANAIVAR